MARGIKVIQDAIARQNLMSHSRCEDLSNRECSGYVRLDLHAGSESLLIIEQAIIAQVLWPETDQCQQAQD